MGWQARVKKSSEKAREHGYSKPGKRVHVWSEDEMLQGLGITPSALVAAGTHTALDRKPRKS